MGDPISRIIISIIIPCYNAECFLPTIIGCLERQAFQDYEVILVNDGGGSLQLAEMQKYKDRNPKIRIIDKENGGVSSARNVGLGNAYGEWIVFVDADDELESYYLQTLYEAVIENHADVAIGGIIQRYVKDRRISKLYITDIQKKLYTGGEVLKKATSMIFNSPCNKIFNAYFIKQHEIEFPLDIHCYEDRIFCMNVYLKGNPKIALVENCGYIYNMRDDVSASSTYKKSYLQGALLSLSLTRELLNESEWTEEEKNEYLVKNIYLLGYFSCCNYFKRGTPMSFLSQVKAIKKDLLQNEEIMEVTKSFNKKSNNFYLSIYDFAIKTNNQIIIAAVFRLIFWCKYKFNKFYMSIATYLRKTNK